MTNIRQIVRRLSWLWGQLTFRKVINYLFLGGAYVFKRQVIQAWPAVLKIDVSPMCNLRCSVCVHADLGDNPVFPRQVFNGKYMSLGQYRKIVDEARGNVAAFSLYYLGDPFMHPDIDEMCRIARDAGINVHLSTNFSFKFTEERIAQIANSGVTHLTVCVDGFSQETYGMTRLQGNLRWVLDNLECLCKYKKVNRLKYPRIEVQYLKFNHNSKELPQAMSFFNRLGIDHVESYWGMVNNYIELDPKSFDVFEPRASKMFPLCSWPFATMLIKYNGDVIPCCNFRHVSQYGEGENARVLGNVFENGIHAVWTSSEYRNLRQLCIKPTGFFADEKFKEHFCYGCPGLFRTSYDKQVKMAPEYSVTGLNS